MLLVRILSFQVAPGHRFVVLLATVCQTIDRFSRLFRSLCSLFDARVGSLNIKQHSFLRIFFFSSSLTRGSNPDGDRALQSEGHYLVIAFSVRLILDDLIGNIVNFLDFVKGCEGYSRGSCRRGGVEKGGMEAVGL